MSCRKYRPSNGTEGMGFMENFCFHCIHECPGADVKPKCEIMTASMLYDLKDKEYPEEWTFDDNGNAICTKYVNWNWGKDDDGNWIEPIVPTDDPNQLCLPFIFDELEIPKIKNVICQ